MREKVRKTSVNKVAVLLLGIVFSLVAAIPAWGQKSGDSLYRATLSQALHQAAERNYPSAIYNFKKCVELSPNDPVPYYRLANIYTTLEDGTQAVYYARKAFSLAPENLWYEEYLLSSAVKFQKVEAVQAVLERRFSRDDSYLGDLLDAYAYTRSWDKALAVVDAYEKKHGRSEQTIGYRKDIYVKSQDYKNALAQLKMLQKISPDQGRYAVQRTMIMQAVGETAQGWKYLEGFFRAHPQDGLVAYTLAPFYLEQKDYEKMFSLLPVAANNGAVTMQDRLKLIDAAAQVATQQEKYAPQVDTALKAILGASEDPAAYAYASDYYYSRGEKDKALGLLRQAVQRGYNNQEAVMRLLYSDAQAEDMDALNRDARLVLDSIGESAEVYYLYSFAAHASGDIPAAAAALERGKELARGGSMPLYVELCSMLGSLYQEMGDTARSVENLELVLRIDPDNAMTLNNYGYYLAVRGKDLPRARGMLEKALQIRPDEPAFLDSYAWILYLMKDYQGALAAMEKSIAADPDPSAEVLEHHFRILEAVGEKEKAEAARKRWEARKARENKIEEDKKAAVPAAEMKKDK